MLPLRLPQTTRVLAKDQPEYNTLCIMDVNTDQGNAMLTLWEPTPDELKTLVRGGRVMIALLGVVHPPIVVTVKEGPTDESLPVEEPV